MSWTRRVWTTEDDVYLRAFHHKGSVAMARDLNRSESGITTRKAHLRKIGAWDLLGEWHERVNEIDQEMISRLSEKGYAV